jgi:HEAT repeat protein/cyclophilin family peptidyl-prolyl cis-trans isomerase
MRRVHQIHIGLALCLLASATAHAQAARRPALSTADVDDIATLEMLEDRRQFDSAQLARILVAPHPELRRRAAMSIARIADKRGLGLLRSRPLDADTSVAATVVFAVGQLRDTSMLAWLDSLLSNPRTPPTLATEAANGLGKLKSAAAREALGRYLSHATASARTTETIGEALLAIGRATPRGDIAPVVKWTTSPNEELRWRAVWALFRPRDPAAVATLLARSADSSPLVRSWAIRALSKPQADSAGIGDKAEAKLLAGARDADRRVRTEAIRALGTYSDSAAIATLLGALTSTDSWISATAAEGLGRIRAPKTAEPLVMASVNSPSCAVRITAMQSLFAFSQADAIHATLGALHHPAPYCQLTALQALSRDTADIPARATGRAGADAFLQHPSITLRIQAWIAHWTILDSELDPAARRTSRRLDVIPADPVVRAASLRAMNLWADTTDLPLLFELYDRASKDTSAGLAASAAVSSIAAVQRRQGKGTAAFLARFGPPANLNLRRDIERTLGAPARQAWPAASAAAAQRPLADYRQIVERWVVSDYNGTPRPMAKWDTPRGPIVLELYPGDAPLAVDDFIRTVETGTIRGAEFTRVVPDFVDQQRQILGSGVLRDEVNRHRLTRANLAWATSGLDTGTPGYTLNHTAQPHNEGDFTSLGHVIEGMDAVDHIELGDWILAAKMIRGGTGH